MSLATQLLADALEKDDFNFKGIGTKLSGYAPPELGPFKCVHCVHFDGESRCNHPVVIDDPEVPKITESGVVKGVVKPNGCCNFVRPPEDDK